MGNFSMKSLVGFFVVLLWLSSAAGKAVKPGDNAKLKKNEALIGFVILASRYTKKFSLRSTESRRLISLKDIPEGVSVHLVKVRAGQYCLHKMSDTSFYYEFEANSVCFTAEAGGIHYPGHIIRRTASVVVGIDREDFEQRLRAEFPAIAEQYLEKE